MYPKHYCGAGHCGRSVAKVRYPVCPGIRGLGVATVLVICDVGSVIAEGVKLASTTAVASAGVGGALRFAAGKVNVL